MIFLIILTGMFAVSTAVLSVLCYRMHRALDNKLDGVDREIERAEKILNNVVVSLRRK